jgi:hypothetical protein
MSDKYKRCVEKLYACLKGVGEEDICSGYQPGYAWVRLKSSLPRACASAFGSTESLAYERLYHHLVDVAAKLDPVPDCAKIDILFQ